MCSPGGAAGATLASGMVGAYGQIQQGKATQNYYNYLADQTQSQVSEVDKATDEQVGVISQDSARQTTQVIQDSNQTIASQKAAMAANGVYSDSATSQDILSDTIDKRALDEAAVRYNADQAIWQTRRSGINQKLELNTKAINYKLEGKNAKYAANANAFSTLVGSATSAGVNYAAMGGKFGSSGSYSGGASGGNTNAASRSNYRTY